MGPSTVGRREVAYTWHLDYSWDCGTLCWGISGTVTCHALEAGITLHSEILLHQFKFIGPAGKGLDHMCCL